MSVIGQNIPLPVRRSNLHDKRDGFIYEEVWEGTASFINGIAFAIRGSPFFISTRVENQGEKYILTARLNAESGSVPTGEPTLELFLDGARHAKDILTSPAASGLTEYERRIIRRNIANPPEEQTPAVFADLSDDALAIYNLMLQGVTDYTVYQPTLRIRRLANTYAALTAAYANVGRIISTTNLPTDAGIDGEIFPALPDDASADPTRAYGWLKHYPSFGPSSREFRQLSYEYEYGFWSTLIYGDLL